MNKYAKYSTILYLILVEFMYGFELTYIKLPDIIYNIFLFISIFLFVASSALGKWTLIEIFRSFLLIVVALGVYFSSGETLFLMMILSCIVIRNVSYSMALKTIFGTRLVSFILVISSSLLGFIPINKMEVAKGAFGTYTGYGLGYQHPNNLAQAFLVLCLLYLAIKNSNLNYKNYVGTLFLGLIFYRITGGKTEFILLFIACLSLIFLKSRKGKDIASHFTIPYVIFTIFLWVVIPFVYATSSGILRNIAYSLNGVLNGRFSNASMLFEINKFTMFGKIVNLDALKSMYGYNVVDNGYVFLLFNYGLIGFLLIIFLYIYAIKSFIKKQIFTYVVIIATFLTLGLMENVIRAMFMNVTIIFWYEFINCSYYKQVKSISQNQIEDK